MEAEVRAPRRARLEWAPIYSMWLRQIIRFFRMKARLISSFVLPVIMLALLAIPMSRLFPPGTQETFQPQFGMPFFAFLASGLIGLTILFGAMMGGITVIWDKEFGFLKEVMVAPVSRFSVITGRSLGGMTTTMIQALIMVAVASLFGITYGFQVQSAGGFWLSIVFMLLTYAVFAGFALVLAAALEETEGFMSIMNLIQLPILFLSGAMIPIANLKGIPFLYELQFINPLTYGVDSIRATLTGTTPYFPLWLDFVVLLAWAIFFWIIGARQFSRMQVD
jgi:ABC-2 type transport system permease protein